MSGPVLLSAMTDWGRALRDQLCGGLRRSRRRGDADPNCRTPVIIVPGVLERWTYLRPLGRWLEDLGHPVRHVRALGWNLHSFEDSARHVREAAAGLESAVIVAHSKGGLIGKLAMLDDANTFAGMVTVATPFAGSAMLRPFQRSPFARRSRFANLFTGSREITALAQRTEVDHRIVSLVPMWDQVVAPESARLATGTTVELDRGGHFGPMRDRRVWEHIHEHVHALSSAR